MLIAVVNWPSGWCLATILTLPAWRSIVFGHCCLAADLSTRSTISALITHRATRSFSTSWRHTSRTTVTT